MNFVAETTSVTVSETTDFELAGYCDIWILGLTSGSVELQVKFPDEETFRAYPDGLFTSDIANSIFISEKGVMGKLVATATNDGTYLRISRHFNT